VHLDIMHIECAHLSIVLLLINVCHLWNSIHGDRIFTHNGERTKEGIVEFTKRAYA